MSTVHTNAYEDALAPLPPTTMPLTESAVAVEHGEKAKHSSTVMPSEIEVTAAPTLVSDEMIPTDEELETLRKVPGPIPMVGYLMCFIELAERASYYGSTGPFNNFINNPLPVGGNGAGAVAKGSAGTEESAGALGLGSVAASAIVNSFQMLAYVIPIYGGIVADTKWGRFKTIAVGNIVGVISHILLVIPAIPKIIAKPNASLGIFIPSVYILSFASGFIKPCLGPLMCDQSRVTVPTLKVLPSGERVIVDPAKTVERAFLVFYLFINVGAFMQLATTYAERYIGFWLAWLLPGIVYLLMPVVLFYCYKRLYHAPPQGSVVLETMKVFRVLLSDGGWHRIFKGGPAFWDKAKPSYIHDRDGQVDINRVFWDDTFVDEIRQSFRACQVFLLIPVFLMADGGIGNSLNSMSTAMRLDGLPNDLLNSFNSLAIILATPVLTWGLFPWLDRRGWGLKPMTKMSIGMMIACTTSILAAIVQWRIYKTSACGYDASTCDTTTNVSLWWQLPIYAWPAIGELFINPVSYELAYTRAPARMKGLVYAIALFNSAIAYAISLACANAIQDPYLIWPWVALAVASFILAFVFPWAYSDLNEPKRDFMNRERQEGHMQPKYIMEHQHDQPAQEDGHEKF